MITLVRKQKDPKADAIEERFKELVLAYQTETDHGVDSPFIIEGNKIIKKEEKIEKWLLELEHELNVQRSISGDGCYIDPHTDETC